jgi:hypothetical protein
LRTFTDHLISSHSNWMIDARNGQSFSRTNDLIAAAFRAQADAWEIEAGAKRRLADEYDAA